MKYICFGTCMYSFKHCLHTMAAFDHHPHESIH